MKLSDFDRELNTRGLVRSNRYEVTFKPPKSLGNIDTRVLTLRCSQAQLPGITFTTTNGAPRYGYGAIESNPYAVLFEDAYLTFLLDVHSDVHKLFSDWTNAIVNRESIGQSRLAESSGPINNKPFEVGFKDDYVTDLRIKIFKDSGSKDGTLTPIQECTLYRAYPKNLPNADFAWENVNDVVRYPVSFTYTDYSNKYF